METYSLLIVDDESIIAKGIRKLVEQSGYPIGPVRTASDGLEALDLIEEAVPHMVFTDIRMPEMDGLELARRIQVQYPKIQTAIISGYGEFEYARRGISYGVKEYLLKPVRHSELERILEKLIRNIQCASGSAVMSVRMMETRIHAIGEAVWRLQHDELNRLLAEWRRNIESFAFEHNQACIVYNDAVHMLLEYLDRKGIYPFSREEVSLAEASSADECYMFFFRKAHAICEELAKKRKGNVIDPIEAAKSYIDSHLSQEASLEEVAAVLGLNGSYFSQLFKQQTGETFVQYRMRKRMEKAALMLEQPHYKVTDIAMETGYSDYSYFSKIFKKYTGYSPSEYRARLGIE